MKHSRVINTLILIFGILCLLGVENWVGLSFSVITGLVAGIVIGQATEYFTSHSYKPTQKIAGSAQTGPATVIIAGIGSGMISTARDAAKRTISRTSSCAK